MSISFSNSYARLPDRFFVRQNPDIAPAPHLVKLNELLADELGLDRTFLNSPQGVSVLAGASVPDSAEPLAMAYAGHQFGNWVPQLGDGRAILLGEVITPDKQRFDIHLKGAGRTAFSRGGDGKAALGAVLREYIVSEAMAALNIPTTRALAAVTTGETILREGPLPGAVLVRVASSHVRVGTFQYFYARQDAEGLQNLLDHVIARHYPDAAKAEIPALAVLGAVINRQAVLIAHWMQVGFIHGVMNTDNMSIAGETIDYGPCAFMDVFDPAKVFSSIDRQGRYAWANQPGIGNWNLAQFAQSLLPLINADPEAAASAAQDVLDQFGPKFQAAYASRMGHKIGLSDISGEDGQLVQNLLDLMAKTNADFTLFFRHLTKGLADDNFSKVAQMTGNSEAFQDWIKQWQARLSQQNADQTLALMRSANPVVIARNHRVEQAIEAAYAGDFTPFETLVSVLQNPFSDGDETAPFEQPPAPDEIVHATFCGT